MTELCLLTKTYLDYCPGRLKYVELAKSTRLEFQVSVPKVFEVVPYCLYPLALRKCIYKSLSGFVI